MKQDNSDMWKPSKLEVFLFWGGRCESTFSKYTFSNEIFQMLHVSGFYFCASKAEGMNESGRWTLINDLYNAWKIFFSQVTLQTKHLHLGILLSCAHGFTKTQFDWRHFHLKRKNIVHWHFRKIMKKYHLVKNNLYWIKGNFCACVFAEWMPKCKNLLAFILKLDHYCHGSKLNILRLWNAYFQNSFIKHYWMSKKLVFIVTFPIQCFHTTFFFFIYNTNIHFFINVNAKR